MFYTDSGKEDSMSVKNLESASESRFAKNSRKSRRKITAAAAVITVGVGAGFGGYLYYGSYYASGWHTHDNATYYISKETGQKVVGYQIIDNTCYIFDESGNMLLDGWYTYRGDKYYLKDGIVVRGTLEIDGEKYYFSDESGVFRAGECKINGVSYY